MYSIGIRIDHGTFHGIKMITNHNFVAYQRLYAGEKVFISQWGVTGEVYQSSDRFRPITPSDTILEI